MEENVMCENFRKEVLNVFPHEPVDIRTYSPLALAFLGDAVYSMIIRTIVASKGNCQADKMHNRTKVYVSAKRQSAIGIAINELLTDEEKKIYKRGRNASPYHHARNATIEEYLEATALEVLCGYMYLNDEMPRFLELLKEGIDRTETVNDKHTAGAKKLQRAGSESDAKDTKDTKNTK